VLEEAQLALINGEVRTPSIPSPQRSEGGHGYEEVEEWSDAAPTSDPVSQWALAYSGLPKAGHIWFPHIVFHIQKLCRCVEDSIASLWQEFVVSCAFCMS
jgi:hypothetical protein